MATQARRALESLRLDWSDSAQPIHAWAIGRWKNYEKHLAPALETLEPLVRAFGYQ